jgi:hypothetical protein
MKKSIATEAVAVDDVCDEHEPQLCDDVAQQQLHVTGYM